MKVCILGGGLTSLALAKTLVNQGIKVDIYSNKKFQKYNKIQTLGISKSNIDFFNKNILDIKKFLWKIYKIEIYTENLKDEKILNFSNNEEQLFSVVKNHELYDHLFFNLNKNKLITFKKKFDELILSKQNYKLIFNCDSHNFLSKKFFYKKISKNYNSFAHITTFKHAKILNNHIASQIFTKEGPIAFLPISKTETSVVYSIKGKKKIDLEKLIQKYNKKYKILKFKEALSFKLKLSNLRNYYHKNIIAFGDILHSLHPLAGQGFNMTIRDIMQINKLIRFKKNHGLDLDVSICSDFEKNAKNKNFIFSNSIDLIYEFFHLDSNLKNKALSKSLKFLGKNKMISKFFIKLADNGLSI